MPGGIAEVSDTCTQSKPRIHVTLQIFLSSDTEEKICASHKGFVKLAIKAGVPIVPVYMFGHTRMFHQLAADNGIAMALSRVIKTSVTIFWGQYYLPIPYPVNMFFAVGRPIVVRKEAHPDAAYVAQVHQQYLDELERLYNTHKKEAGYDGIPLRFIS